MDKLKQWVALTVLASVAVLAAGWFLLVAPKRGEAADLRVQAEEQLATNRTLAGELEVLKAQARDLPQKQAELASVAAKIPDNPALPGLIRQLMEAADAADVQLVSIAPGEPVLKAPPVPATPAAPEEGAAQVDGAAAPADPAAPAPPSPAGTLAEIPLAVNVVGDYYGVQRFLARAEELSRAVLVTNLTVAPGASPTAGDDADATAVERGKSLTATINGFVYMAANRPAPTTAAVPADAAPVAATAETAE
jgi:Tfp pilus assembly protein PilO